MSENLSIYSSLGGKAKCLALYDAALSKWPVPYEELNVKTHCGPTHVIASGPAKAPPLVLLHGQWATATMWSSFVADLARDHRVYAVDQIDDVGRSAPTRLPASRQDYADWMEDVFDGLQLAYADIAGLSYGGFLAVNFALCAPNRVSKLILLCPGLPALGRPTAQWALHGMPAMLVASAFTARWLVQGLTVQSLKPGDLHSEQLMAGAMHIRKRVPFRPVIEDAEFARLKLPVLLVIGDQETMYPPKEAAQRGRQLFPQVQIEIIPGAGHMLNTDQPEAVGRVMRQFLD